MEKINDQNNIGGNFFTFIFNNQPYFIPCYMADW